MTLDDAIESLTRYAEHGIPTGSFLRAVLENDLMEAVNRGDDVSLLNLPAIVRHVYNQLSWDCHGSPLIVREFLKRKSEERAALVEGRS